MEIRGQIIAFLLVLILPCSAPAHPAGERKPFPPPRPEPASPAPTFEDFVGSEVCAECHKEQYDLWRRSTHGRAGGPATPETVIGRFDSTTLQFRDARVTPFVDANDVYRFTVEQTAFAPKAFRVDYVVGGGHLLGGGTQTYFSRFPDGTVRFLPFDFIRKENLWFGETRHARGWVPISEELALTDLSEWPPARILGEQRDFENCQQCHGSQIQTRYDPAVKKYVTRFKSLAINCESCHGPGKKHVELARSGEMFNRRDIGMVALSTLSKDASLAVCFRCHALKDALEPGDLPGANLLRHYSLKFPMLGENPYHPDGRVRAFGYQQNHLYSDCYLNGSMTCVDCHDPHAQTYRDVNGRELVGRFDNGQCTGCHASKAEPLTAHTRHKPDSPGSLCTSCHMPYLQHQAMGTRLRFARSDHTIPIPRPAFDAQLGIENACKKCHQEKSIEALQAQTEAWYGTLKPHKPVVTNLLALPRTSDRVQAGRLALADTSHHVMARMAGLAFFVERFLEPDMPALEPEIVRALKRLTETPDPDLKALALAALHLSRDQDVGVHDFLLAQLARLGAEEPLVRRRWTVALAYLAGVYRDRGDLESAIRTYRKALEIHPDDADVLLNLGVAYRDAGQLEQAVGCFERAGRIAPDQAAVWVNLGLTHVRAGDEDAAASAYLKAVEANPWHALAFFNLANHYYRVGDLRRAVPAYHRAVELDPALAPGYFNLARAYLRLRQPRRAWLAVRAGLQYDPENAGARQMARDLEAFLLKK